MENCAVKKVETCRKRSIVTSVVTSHGVVKCDYFINAAGQVTPIYSTGFITNISQQHLHSSVL